MQDDEQTIEPEVNVNEEDNGPEKIQKNISSSKRRSKKDSVSPAKDAKGDKESGDQKNSNTVKEDILPEQGNLVNKFVDVYDENGKRLGVGKCLRDDFGIPWINEVKMIVPPKWDGKVLKNKKIRLCLTQQVMEIK